MENRLPVNLETVSCNYCNSNNYKVIYQKDGFNIVKCKECDFVFVNPRLTSKEILSLYNQDYFQGKGFDKSVQYEEEFNQQAEKKDLLDWDLVTLKEKINLSNNSRPLLLDVGSGMGLFLWKAKKKGFEVKGLELSEFACHFMKKKGIEVFNSTIDEFVLPQNHFDIISLREVVEHLTDPLASLKKIFASLKKGGMLFITTGNYDCPERKLKGSNWNYFMPQGHLSIFSNKTIKNFLIKAGYSRVEVTNQGDLLMSFLFQKKIIDDNSFVPKNYLKKLIFYSTRGINHFISSGLRVYAKK